MRRASDIGSVYLSPLPVMDEKAGDEAIGDRMLPWIALADVVMAIGAARRLSVDEP